MLEKCFKVDCKEDNPETNAYLKIIIESLTSEHESIIQYFERELKEDLFVYFLDDNQIQAAKDRLGSKIIPNAFIDSNLQENPLELRNILYGTWLELGESITSDIALYEDNTTNINHLSIKGIELSIEQENFNNDALKK